MTLSIRLQACCAAIFALAIAGLSVALEIVLSLEPCPLCLVQRYLLFLLSITYLLTAALPRPGWRLIANTMNASLASLGVFFAAKQVAMQHLPAGSFPACGPSLTYMLQTLPWQETWSQLLNGTGDCAEITWRWLGLSLADWSVISFAGLLLLSVWHWLKDFSATSN